MAGSVFDSAIYRDLMGDREVAALFTDSAEVRAMMIVEGALAKVQGALGLIPEVSAAAIHRASLELQIDPGGLAAETGKNAVVVPALVAAFRSAMQAPEHAQWLHYGATSQDIMDTSLVLRLRQFLGLIEPRLRETVAALGALAETHAETPMAGRTYGQIATPTSFGAVVASWGGPLISLLDRLEGLRARLLCVSLSGAAGTLSAMGPKGPEVRAELAKALGLSDPEASWHSNRTAIAELSGWLTQITAQLGKMGQDLILLTQSGIGEVALPGSGGSSTMPQKQNPVMPSVLAAIARQMVGLNSVMQGAATHTQERDAAAWISEWMTLPQMCLAASRATQIALDLARGIKPKPEAMLANLDDGSGLIFAEALQFKLAATMPRPEAQAAVKALCQDVAGGGSLKDRATKHWPDLDLAPVFDAANQLGEAPDIARRFAKAARKA